MGYWSATIVNRWHLSLRKLRLVLVSYRSIKFVFFALFTLSPLRLSGKIVLD